MRQTLKSGFGIFDGLPVFAPSEILGRMRKGEARQPAGMHLGPRPGVGPPLTYKGGAWTPESGRYLGVVRYLLDGSLRRTGISERLNPCRELPACLRHPAPA